MSRTGVVGSRKAGADAVRAPDHLLDPSPTMDGMEDVVAVRVRLRGGGSRYFLTWGRLFDPVDPTQLEDAVREHLDKFDLGGKPVSVKVCSTLQEAAAQPYFFEALWWFGQQKVPYGPGYKRWVSSKRRRLKDGDELRYLGNPLRKAVRSGKR